MTDSAIPDEIDAEGIPLATVTIGRLSDVGSLEAGLFRSVD